MDASLVFPYGLIAAVALAEAWPLVGMWCAAGCCCAGVGLLAAKDTRRIARTMLAGSLGLIAGCGFVAWHTNRTPADLLAGVAAPIRIEGTAIDRELRRQGGLSYLVDATRIGDTAVSRFRVQVADRGGWPRIDRGDAVVVTAEVLPTDPGYARYLASQGIRATVTARDIRSIGPARRDPLAWLGERRDAAEASINTLLPEPHGSLLAGLLLGSRTGMPPDLTERMRRAGLSHIVAISGQNMTLVAWCMWTALFFLPLRWRLPPSIAAIAVFALFVGGGASVNRAAIMGILGLIALGAGRLADSRRMIPWTAAGMLAWNPLLLWEDAGFQLSFLAVIGLQTLVPRLQPWTCRVPRTFGIRESIECSLAAQIMTLPLLLWRFGQTSLVSPLANILVAPLIPQAMLWGTIALVAETLHKGLGLAPAAVAWLLLDAIFRIAMLLGGLSWAAVPLSIPAWGAGMGYAVFFVLLTFPRMQKNQRR